MEVTILEADLADDAHGEALLELIDSYAREPLAQNAPLDDGVRSELVQRLREHPACLALLAFAGPRPVGVAVCFRTFSTFAARPALNVHDLAVLPALRGRGIGSRLLQEVERRAIEAGCCQITLEVHDANAGAKRLYERFGFGPWERPTLFVTKRLHERSAGRRPRRA